MQVPPTLTDRPALIAQRSRARLQGPVEFLHQEALVEVEERLNEVNRQFTDIAVVTGHREFWAAAFPNALIVPDEAELDVAPRSFDLVIHALALHWADDPVGQLVQSRNALRPDGLFLAVLFGGQTLHELRVALAEAETALTGGLSPRIAPMGEVRDLGALLQRAGLALPVADISRRSVEYSSALHLMKDLRHMGEGNALAQRHRAPLPRAVLDLACDIYGREFPGDKGRVRATFEFVFLTGWAPSRDQPRPMRPGSASHRLAEALGTVEYDRDMNPVTAPTPRDKP
ncbi:methyltransferase domain-containing protein [Tropicimonas sp. S265A]|uniref:methyltransferase domain-containing protein n=1 Tax=Tropicimonas sp. S265A TaxID=3415134 RepID=UPI003C7DAAF6